MSGGAGWSNGQVNNFARWLAASPDGRAWWAFADDIRESLIDRYVVGIVLGQDREFVGVEAIRELRKGIAVRVASHHGMPNPIADMVRES